MGRMALRGEFGACRGMGVFRDIYLTLNTASLTLKIYNIMSEIGL
jgi:hypothetical protein